MHSILSDFEIKENSYNDLIEYLIWLNLKIC